ncbi:MAG: ATP-binding cassette domain-containing protein [Bacteroidetes bacterium]|nr:ATP-binding cassette domain-containing protein [Bacteroidota bacterium]
MSPIIKVKQLGKRYTIRHEARERYTALRDVINKKTKTVFRRSKKSQPAKEEFWALKELSFELKQGEALGIVGRNGAGKSTLLKLLSRITEPSTGEIEIRGKVATLLEVGTGFHPELTGKENIFLNGAILGMKRHEIKKRFDEIVDFSGVEKFIDTPVKRFSSGMYMRLAFAIAAHLEPDILIVDEVLAVGDAEFQEKCLGKMNEVTKEKGRTVLFVSHNLSAIQQLCPLSLCLQNGRLSQIGPTKNVIDHYLDIKEENCKFIPHSNKDIYIADFFVEGENSSQLIPGKGCLFTLVIYSKTVSAKLHFGIGVNDKMGNRIFTPFTKYDSEGLVLQQGDNQVHCQIESLPLMPGNYDIHLYVGSAFDAYDYVAGGVHLTISPYPFFKYTMPVEGQGAVILKQNWYL